MELTITLPAEFGTPLRLAAARTGRAIEDYVVDAVKIALLKPSLDELLAPVRAEFAASGMTEDEYDALIETERQVIWDEKHGKKN